MESPKIKQGKYLLFSEGLDPDQFRSVDWYWEKRNGIVDKFKKLRRRLFGSK